MRKSKLIVFVLAIMVAVTLIVLVEESKPTVKTVYRENLGLHVIKFDGRSDFWNVSISATNYGDSPVQINSVCPYPLNETSATPNYPALYCNGTQVNSANLFRYELKCNDTLQFNIIAPIMTATRTFGLTIYTDQFKYSTGTYV